MDKSVYNYVYNPSSATQPWTPQVALSDGGSSPTTLTGVVARLQALRSGTYRNLYALDPAADTAFEGDSYVIGAIAGMWAYSQDALAYRRANLVADNADNQAPIGASAGLVSMARLQGFDGTNYDRLRTLADSADDAASSAGLLGVVNRGQLYDGAAWDLQRAGSATNIAAQSGLGAALVAQVGEWSINHNPAANTQATITRAAGAAGVRHVCRSISCSLVALTAAAEAQVEIRLRDGATGAGTILWALPIMVIPGGQTGLTISGLNIVGSAATAMTLEFSAAGGASTTQGVSLTGFDVS